MLPIFLIVLVDVFALTLVLPLLAIYSEKFGATPVEATLVVSTFAACQLISGPLLGRISDRTGRKPMLIVSQVGTLIGFILMARAESLAMIFVARIIDGATAGNLSLAQAWISDHTKPEARTKSFAIIGIAFGLGFFVGPAITGRLAGYSLAAPIWLAASMSAVSILCTILLLPGGTPPEKPRIDGDGPAGKRLSVLAWGAYRPYFARPVLAGLLVQFFFFMIAFSTFTSGFALYAERTFQYEGHPFTPREIGYVFAYSGFLGLIIQGGLIGRLVQRFGDAKLAALGFVFAASSYVALGVVHQLGPLAIVATLSAFGTAVLRPTLSSMISQTAGPHEQGVVLGLSQSLGSLAAIIAPPIGGILLEQSWRAPWAWTAALASLVGLVAARWGSSRVRAGASATT